MKLAEDWNYVDAVVVILAVINPSAAVSAVLLVPAAERTDDRGVLSWSG